MVSLAVYMVVPFPEIGISGRTGFFVEQQWWAWCSISLVWDLLTWVSSGTYKWTMLHRHFGYFSGAQRRGLGWRNKLELSAFRWLTECEYGWDCLEREVHLKRKVLPWKQTWVTLVYLSAAEADRRDWEALRRGRRKASSVMSWKPSEGGFQERRDQLCWSWGSSSGYRSTAV